MFTAAEIPSVQPRERRLKRLRVSHEALVGLFRLDGQRLLTIEGMPADAQIVGVRQDVSFDTFDFLVSSKSFPPVAPECCIPDLDLTCREQTLVPGLVLPQR